MLIWPFISLDSPPWQVRQNWATLLLVVVLPGLYQPRTKKDVGLMMGAPAAVFAPVLNQFMTCWLWQVVQVTHEVV